MVKQKKFMKIYEALKEDILNGQIQYGEQIPSEHDLVQLYQSSRETVRKALDLLALDGMIQKIHGKGSQSSHFLNLLVLKKCKKKWVSHI